MNTEQIDVGLAGYSDATFTASIVVLVLALVLLSVELASSRGRRVERRQPHRERGRGSAARNKAPGGTGSRNRR